VSWISWLCLTGTHSADYDRQLGEKATEMILRTVIAIVVVLLVVLAFRVFRSWRH
jgi:hypothetical protein